MRRSHEHPGPVSPAQLATFSSCRSCFVRGLAASPLTSEELSSLAHPFHCFPESPSRKALKLSSTLPRAPLLCYLDCEHPSLELSNSGYSLSTCLCKKQMLARPFVTTELCPTVCCTQFRKPCSVLCSREPDTARSEFNL